MKSLRSPGRGCRDVLRLARAEGLLVGISSGANVVASLRIAQRLGAGKTVVTILADTESATSLPLHERSHSSYYAVFKEDTVSEDSGHQR